MRLIFLLFLVPLLYASPPINETMGDNDEMAEALEDYYNESIAENSSITLTFGEHSQELSLFVSVDIAGLNLMLDNMTHPAEGLMLITARGYEQEHLTSLPSDGYPNFPCDRSWFDRGAEPAWRCDFDEDYCVEFENRTWMDYGAEVNFTFRNISESVPFSSNAVAVPENILEEMKTSSGSENLTVIIEGNATFTYQINDRGFEGDDCVSSYYEVSESVPFSVNATFTVAGGQKLFFLRAPVLREQWFRNNQFNTILLSQSPLYYAEIRMDGNQSWNFTIREFYNATGPYGLQLIISNMTEGESWSEAKNGSTPIPLQEEDYSFAYIYEFNHSYSGIGKHNLSLHVNDSFLGTAQYKEILFSRMLSYNGTYTEEGSPADESARPSAGLQKQELSSVEIALGFVVLVLFLSFFYFWSPK